MLPVDTYTLIVGVVDEELERLLAMAPVYNFARYDVYLLAEVDSPADTSCSRRAKQRRDDSGE